MITLVEITMMIVLLLDVSMSLFINLSSLEADDKPKAAHTWFVSP